MTNVEKLLAEWERDEREGHPVGEQGIPIETAVRMLRRAIEAAPEQPSVDWLDPARESCLIDGVRYTRAKEGVPVLIVGEGESYVVRAVSDTDWDALDSALWRIGNGENVEAALLVPIDQHPEGGET